MEEQHRISVDIQARIGSLLGGEQLLQNLSQLEEQGKGLGSTGDIYGQFRGSEGYAELVGASGMSPKEIKTFQHGMQSSAEAITEKTQAGIADTYARIQGELDIYRDVGRNPSISTIGKYHNWVEEDVQKAYANIDNAIKEHTAGRDPEDSIVQGETQALLQRKENIRSTADTFLESIDKFAKGMQKGSEETAGFVESLLKFENISRAIHSVEALASYAIQRGIVTEAQIGARYETAFDLTSQMGAYGEAQRASLFEETSRRTTQAGYIGKGIEVGSTLAGIVGMIAIGGPIGLGVGRATTELGRLAGQYVEAGAQAENIEETAGIEKDLKFINQIRSIAEPRVSEYRQYDIAHTQMVARLGHGAGGRSLGDLAYTPQEEIAMKSSFAGAYGRYDKGLFREQTEFALGKGLNPNEVYGVVGQAEQYTGEKIGLGPLYQARDIARQQYGAGADEHKTIDILNSINSLTLQGLQKNTDYKIEDAYRLAQFSHGIFGDSAYGRIDQMGGMTLQGFNNLLQPRGLPQEALMYSILGKEGSLWDFEKIKMEGFTGGGKQGEENLQKMMKGLSPIAQGLPPEMVNFMVKGLVGEGIPADVIEKITTILQSGGDIKTDYKELSEELKTAKEKHKESVDSAISQSKAIITAVETSALETGKRWNKLLGDMDIDMGKFFTKIDSSQDKMEEVRIKGMAYVIKSWVDNGQMSPNAGRDYIKSLYPDPKEQKIALDTAFPEFMKGLADIRKKIKEEQEKYYDERDERTKQILQKHEAEHQQEKSPMVQVHLQVKGNNPHEQFHIQNTYVRTTGKKK